MSDVNKDESIHAEHSPVQSVRVDLGGVTLLAIVCFGIVIGAAGVVMGIDIAERTSLQRAFENEQRAWRMEELKYDELNLTLQRAGIVLPGDYRRGVTGNTQEKK